MTEHFCKDCQKHIKTFGERTWCIILGHDIVSWESGGSE